MGVGGGGGGGGGGQPYRCPCPFDKMAIILIIFRSKSKKLWVKIEKSKMNILDALVGGNIAFLTTVIRGRQTRDV